MHTPATTGEFYRRICRHGEEPLIANDQPSFIRSGRTLRVLLDELDDVLLYIDPDPRYKLVTGPRIQALLLTACSYVEAEWAGILHTHRQSPINGKFFTTKDYVKLEDAMSLSGYGVSLSQFPDFPSIRPFHRWIDTAPTTSLLWYDAYNAYKHNAHQNSHRACFNCVLHACAAYLVLCMAQYGWSHFFVQGAFEQPIFSFRRSPQISKGQQYIAPDHPNSWKAVVYPF